MKKTISNKSTLFVAMALAGAVTVPLANAASNPFSNTELASGFNLDHPVDSKSGGEGKCGEKDKCPEGKCGEGKCGEKCGNKHDSSDADKSMAEGKCGEGMDMGDQKKAEAKQEEKPR